MLRTTFVLRFASGYRRLAQVGMSAPAKSSPGYPVSANSLASAAGAVSRVSGGAPVSMGPGASAVN